MLSPTNPHSVPISLMAVRDLHLQNGRIDHILAGKAAVEARSLRRIRSGMQPGWTKSALAGVYTAELYREAVDRLALDPGVWFYEVRGQKFLRLSSNGQAVIGRFKKVGPDWRSQNFPTAQSTDWNGQRPLLDVPPCPRIEYVYQLDFGRIQRVAVLLRVGNTVEWIWQVSGYPTDKFPFDVPAHELPGIHRSTHQTLIHHRYLWEPLDNAVMI